MGQPLDNLHLDHQTITFLGVQAEANIGLGGSLGLFQNAGVELGHDQAFLHRVVLRVQGGQLHADPVNLLYRALATLGSNRRDRIHVTLVIALGVGIGACALTQHVKAEQRTHRAIHLPAPTAFDRIVDIAPQHKLLAQNAHSPTRRSADDRFAHATSHATEIAARVSFGIAFDIHQRTGEHQPQRRGIDQPVIGLPGVLSPFAGADLLRDQVVSGIGIRNA